MPSRERELRTDQFCSVEMDRVLLGGGCAIRAWILEMSFKRQHFINPDSGVHRIKETNWKAILDKDHFR